MKRMKPPETRLLEVIGKAVGRKKEKQNMENRPMDLTQSARREVRQEGFWGGLWPVRSLYARTSLREPSLHLFSAKEHCFDLTAVYRPECCCAIAKVCILFPNGV